MGTSCNLTDTKEQIWGQLPKIFLRSAAWVLMHTRVSASTVLTDLLLLPAFWNTPDIQNKDMWLIFPTNCLQGLLISWVIRNIPAFFIVSAVEWGWELSTFKIIMNLRAAMTEERGEKRRKKRRVGDRDDMEQNTSSFSTRIPKIHQGMPSPLFLPKAP